MTVKQVTNRLVNPSISDIFQTSAANNFDYCSTNYNWSIEQSKDLYGINKWGNSYFGINNLGHVTVSPLGFRGGTLDLFHLVQDLKARNISLPLLIHFPDILGDRIDQLHSCFAHAIAQYGYEGSYQGVFPIKVNQQRYVVESVVNSGKKYQYGLEAGSKPELLIALTQMKDSNAFLVCNGYKDKVYIETALLARRLGYQTIVVIEQLSELDLVIDIAKSLGIKPVIGLRAKLSCKSNSHWGSSAGDRAKFGLTTTEIIKSTNRLQKEGMLECLQLLHFHIGSQISAIAAIKNALSEASQIYLNLCRLGANMKYFDVGGGLGIDYDGSQTSFYSSKNYSMQNYANDVVAEISIACKNHNLQPPIIISESGRAIASHQSVLLFDILGVDEIDNFDDGIEITNSHSIVNEIYNIYQSIDETNFQESYNDVLQVKKEVESLFSLGYLSLQERAKAECLFWRCCQLIQTLVKDRPDVSDDLKELDEILASIYYSNFSVFQSAPDSWAINQLFPIMPIHCLDEKPTELGIIADITCDSDGRIAKFIGRQNVKTYLELHKWQPNRPYYLGMFLSGAYQEILGSLHNLFGDTNVAHISLCSDGYHVEHVVKGDSIAEVLRYVQHNDQDMIESMRQETERAFKEKRTTLQESLLLLEHYKNTLDSYTYLT